MPWTDTPGFPTLDSRRTRLVRLADGRALVTLTGDAAQSALFDVATGRWTEPSTMIAARQSHALVALPDGHAIAIGGGEPDRSVDCQLFDPGTRKWRTGPALPVAMTRHSAVLSGGRVLAIDGESVAAWTPGESEWERLPDVPARFYSSVAAALDDGSVLLVSTGSDAGSVRFDGSTDSWTVIDKTPDTNGAAVVSLGDAVVIAGGEYGRGFSSARISIWREAGGWTPGTQMPEGRASCGAVALGDGRMAVIGGTDNDTDETGGEMDIEYRSATWSYDPVRTTLFGTPGGTWKSVTAPACTTVEGCCALAGGVILAIGDGRCWTWRP